MATEARVLRAFEAGVASIANNAPVTAIRSALRRGDYESAIALIDIEDAAFDDLRVALVEVYANSGSSEIASTKGLKGVRWNSATPQAEQYARGVIGEHITRITADMRDAVRWTIGDGIAYGRSIDRMALDIVGRVDGNKRVGGIVGLNQQQAQWVANMRRYLDVYPDWPSYSKMTKRDFRFDKIVREAWVRGEPLTKAQIDRITQQYSNKLLMLRGRTIARTEAGLAKNAGRIEAWRQAADKLGISYDDIQKEWLHGVAGEPRLTHLAAHGSKVMGLTTSFSIGGIRMLYPHDPQAPASEVINCGCQVRYSIPKRSRNG